MSELQSRIQIKIGGTYINRLGDKTKITECDNLHWPCYKDTNGNRYNKYGREWSTKCEDFLDIISEVKVNTN